LDIFMSENENSPGEIFDRLSQTWGQQLKNEGSGMADDCHLSEKTIAYAMGDLSADEIDIIAGHLHSCRFCVNLILDLRMAEDESRESAGELIQVLPALANAVQTGSNRSSLLNVVEKLAAPISKLWSYIFIPKILVPVATACLAFIIIHFGLNDNDTHIKYQTVRKRIETPKHINRLPAKTPSGTIAKEDLSVRELSETQNKAADNGTIYSISPLNDNEPPMRSENLNRARRVPQTPLERFDLSRLMLVGIIISSDGNIAVIEDSSGKGYIVEKGAYIGFNSAKIIEIKKDRILIEEKTRDASGKTTIKKRELKLHNKD
jgi:Tfp pilus assembly protein PilP